MVVLCAPVGLGRLKRAVQSAPRLKDALLELDPARRTLGCQDLAHGRSGVRDAAVYDTSFPHYWLRLFTARLPKLAEHADARARYLCAKKTHMTAPGEHWRGSHIVNWP
jgi:hypothetical protein